MELTPQHEKNPESCPVPAPGAEKGIWTRRDKCHSIDNCPRNNYCDKSTGKCHPIVSAGGHCDKDIQCGLHVRPAVRRGTLHQRQMPEKAGYVCGAVLGAI